MVTKRSKVKTKNLKVVKRKKTKVQKEKNTTTSTGFRTQKTYPIDELIQSIQGLDRKKLIRLMRKKYQVEAIFKLMEITGAPITNSTVAVNRYMEKLYPKFHN